MANISDANGKLTLVGDWTKEAIDIFLPVLRSWAFYGQYGIQDYGELSEEKLSADFSGYGRWAFGGTLNSFDEWTRSWIEHVSEGGEDYGHPLTAEQYDLFLKTMHENNLSINAEYDDVERGFDIDVHETGIFTSDGKELLYEQTGSKVNIRKWKDFGKPALNAAVDYFMEFVEDADEPNIRKWVKKNVEPTDGFEGLDRFERLDDWFDEPGETIPFGEESIQNFIDTFSPDTDEWENFISALREDFEWFAPPFWEGLSDDELEIDMEKGTITYHESGPFGSSTSWANIKDSEDLRKRFNWRDNFPFDIDYWHSVKQVAVGRDAVSRLKSDGNVVTVSHTGFVDKHESLFGEKWDDIVAIAAGYEHQLGLKADGTVFESGFNEGYGEHDVSGWTDITAIAAGAYHSIGLRKDGTVVATGNNQFGQCDVGDLTDVKAVAAGGAVTIALKNNGDVVFIGADSEKFDASAWHDIITVDAGEMYVLGLKGDGTFIAFDNSPNGLIENGCDFSKFNDITAIAAGGWHVLGLNKDGTVVATGDNDFGQCDTQEWNDIVSIAAGKEQIMKELRKTECPRCRSEISDGICPNCGYPAQ